MEVTPFTALEHEIALYPKLRNKRSILRKKREANKTIEG